MRTKLQIAWRRNVQKRDAGEFVNGVAAMTASGEYGATLACAGIVGFADLTLTPELVADVESQLRDAGWRIAGERA